MATTITDRFGSQISPATVATGLNGWTPLFAIVSSGDKRFLQLVEWTGGTGDEPDGEGEYLGADGLVSDTGTAVDLRGAAGASGSGTGDMLAAQNLADVSSALTSFNNIKQNADTGYAGVVELADTGEHQAGASVVLAATPSGVASFYEPLGKFRGLNTQTAAYTLVITDAGKNVEINSSSARQVTIPTNANVAFPTGTFVTVTRYGSGAVTVKGDTGVTVNGVSAGTVTVSSQYGAVTLYKRGTNEWVIVNQTAA